MRWRKVCADLAAAAAPDRPGKRRVAQREQARAGYVATQSSAAAACAESSVA